MPTKYISKIIKGGDDIYIKDSQAQDALYYKDIYIGAAASSSTIKTSTYHHDSILRGRPIAVDDVTSGDYIWVILPDTYSPIVIMGGLEVPMSLNGTATIDSKSYKVWRSDNTYVDDFSISLM